MNPANQWELDARCDICRKQSYCSKMCKRRKKLVKDYQDRQMNQAALFNILAKGVKVNKVNDQVFEALSQRANPATVDNGVFDALAEKL